MTVWFEGRSEIGCTIQQVKDAFENPGQCFAGVVGLMPGMTSVELVDEGADFVTIKTNEGLMQRTSISTRIGAGSVEVEFDEKYEAGSRVTATAHFAEQFAAGDGGVTHRLVISDVAAPGLLGFLYRRFGGTKTGNAFLNAEKGYFERLRG